MFFLRFVVKPNLSILFLLQFFFFQFSFDFLERFSAKQFARLANISYIISNLQRLESDKNSNKASKSLKRKSDDQTKFFKKEYVGEEYGTKWGDKYREIKKGYVNRIFESRESVKP